MALTQNEKELLAVVKYYNANEKHVAKLVAKLDKEFGAAVASELTGFSPTDVEGFKLTVKPRVSRKIQKVIDQGKKDVEELYSERLAIHINGESDLPQRVAYDMAKFIEKNLNPGDPWLSRKEAMSEFDCKSATLTIANSILVEHNWIEFTEPGNFRKGYVVK